MTLCFRGEFHSTRFAVLRSTFGRATAVGALGWKSFAYSWQSSAVYIFVARLAQSNAILDIVTQFFMIIPRLDVMRLNSAGVPALLACVIVSFVHGITPLFVLVGVALFVGVSLAFRCVAALLTAILCLQVSIGGVKCLTAPLACKERLWPINGVTLVGAFGRTKAAVASDIAKRLSADGANGSKALVAFPCVRVLSSEPISALLAGALFRLKRRRVIVSHVLHYTPACAMWQSLERWATHTGKTPVLIPNDAA